MDAQRPFAGSQHAVDEGHLAVRPDGVPRSRRYIPDFPQWSFADQEDRIRYGLASHVPEVRRLTSRA